MKVRSALPPDEVADAKRRFLAASVPLNPMLMVKEKPLTSVGAFAAVGLIVGVLSTAPFLKLLTGGWASKAAGLGIAFLQQRGLAAMTGARPTGEPHAMG